MYDLGFKASQRETQLSLCKWHFRLLQNVVLIPFQNVSANQLEASFQFANTTGTDSCLGLRGLALKLMAKINAA